MSNFREHHYRCLQKFAMTFIVIKPSVGQSQTPPLHITKSGVPTPPEHSLNIISCQLWGKTPYWNTNLTTDEYPNISASNGFSANVGQATRNVTFMLELEMKKYNRSATSLMRLFYTWKYNHLISFLLSGTKGWHGLWVSNVSKCVVLVTRSKRTTWITGNQPTRFGGSCCFCAWLCWLSFCWYNTSHPIMGV